MVEVVNEGGDEDEVANSDGEVLGFETLVFAIFEFVDALVEAKRFRGAVKSGLSDLMYYIVLYMQITGACSKFFSNCTVKLICLRCAQTRPLVIFIYYLEYTIYAIDS